MAVFDEERIRKELREVLAVTRICRLELTMKDNPTLRHEPQLVVRWVQIAREEIDRL
jgi:hypothetical protein